MYSDLSNGNIKHRFPVDESFDLINGRWYYLSDNKLITVICVNHSNRILGDKL